MFLRLIPDLRRLNPWSAVSFRYAAAPIWSLTKHPVLTATPVVAASRLQTYALQRLPTYFHGRRNFQALPVFLYNPAADRKCLRYRSGSFPRVDSSSALFKSSLNIRHPMTKFQNPAWQNLLQEAVNETDSGRLSEKVQAVEAAIFLRLQELSVLPDNQQELEALQTACAELLKIQTQRLKWPSNFAGSSDAK